MSKITLDDVFPRPITATGDRVSIEFEFNHMRDPVRVGFVVYRGKPIEDLISDMEHAIGILRIRARLDHPPADYSKGIIRGFFEKMKG